MWPKIPKVAKHFHRYTLAWVLASLRSWSKGNLVADGRTWRKFTISQNTPQPTLCDNECSPGPELVALVVPGILQAWDWNSRLQKNYFSRWNLWKKLMTKGRSLENGWGEAWVVEIPNKSKVIRTSMICCLQIFLEENLKWLKEILELNCRTSKREPWLAQKYFVTVFSFHLYLPVVSG